MSKTGMTGNTPTQIARFINSQNVLTEGAKDILLKESQQFRSEVYNHLYDFVRGEDFSFYNSVVNEIEANLVSKNTIPPQQQMAQALYNEGLTDILEKTLLEKSPQFRAQTLEYLQDLDPGLCSYVINAIDFDCKGTSQNSIPEIRQKM